MAAKSKALIRFVMVVSVVFCFVCACKVTFFYLNSQMLGQKSVTYAFGMLLYWKSAYRLAQPLSAIFLQEASA
jgi:hypothetical protein